MKLKINSIDFDGGEIRITVIIEPTVPEIFTAFEREYVYGSNYTTIQIRNHLQARLDEFSDRYILVENAQTFIGTELTPS